MANLSVLLSIVGQTIYQVGKLPVQCSDGTTCLVSQHFKKEAGVPSHQISIDVSDCTSFMIEHIGQDGCDMSTAEACLAVLDRSIEAVSEAILWMKSKDVSGQISPFSRQIGILDVKLFMTSPNDALFVMWHNPVFGIARGALNIADQLLGNMVMSNGPLESPTHWIVRRVQSSLDLLNLGFFTESFVTVFALTDDLIQEVVKAGLSERGLRTPKQQKELLLAIKEERLHHMLGSMLLVCGWKSLREDNEALFKQVVKANTKRNHIMHGPERLTRQEAIEHTTALLSVINWLRPNPFGYHIPHFPLLRAAFPGFQMVNLAES